MDMTTGTTTAAAATIAASVKTPEAKNETPARIQPIKTSSFSNGVLKRTHPLHTHHHYHPSLANHHHHQKPPPAVTYKECLKNHAASLGGHAVDGCGEFMPSPTATPSDPTSLKCAACGCHRNFHRREPEVPVLIPNATAALEYQPHHRHHPPPPAAPPAHHNSGGHSSPSSSSPPPISSSYYPSAPHMLLALSAGLSAPPTESNMPITPPSATARGGMSGNPNGRKRFRTKFTPDQKERMLQFAERVGWKIQKRDEELIGDFCNEIGVNKGVLKVWMHNNKNNFGRRDQANNTSADTVPCGTPAAARDNGNGLEFTIHYHHNDENNNDNENGIHNHDLSRQMHNSDSVAVATNGSSTS